MIKFLLGMLVGFTILYTIQDHEHAQPPEKLEAEIDPTFPIRDSTRKIHALDWKNNKYIYEDEVEPSVVYPPSSDPLPYQPDYAVTMDAGGGSTQATYVIVDGKRYKTMKRGNGDIVLKPWR